MSLLPVVMPERAVTLTVAVGWALVWFVAQGSLVSLVVAAFLRALRSRSANLRYVTACAGLIAMLLCPVGTTLRLLAVGRSRADAAMASARPGAVPTPRHDQTEGATAIVGAPPLSAAPSPAVRQSTGGGIHAVESAPVATTNWDFRWWEQIEACLPAVVAAWLIGVGVMALRLAKGLVDVRGLTRRGTLAPTEELQDLIGCLIAGILGLVAAAWLAEPTQARDELAPKPTQSTIRGRVLDEAAGAGEPAPVDPGEVDSFNEQAKLTIRASGGQVKALAIAPDGKVLGTVTATEGGIRSGPGELQLYEVASRKLLATVKEPAGLHTIAFAADGKTLATGGYDRTVKVRDATTGAILATLGGFDRTVKSLHADTGAILPTPDGFGNLVSAVAFASDGKTLAAGCLDESVRIWDTATWKCISTIPVYGQSVLSLAFAPDAKTLAVGTGVPGGGVGALTLFDAVTVRLLRRFDKIEGAVRSVAFAPDGKTLAIASLGIEGGGASIWDPASGQRLRAEAPGLVVDTVAFAPDGNTLAAGLGDGRIILLESGTRFRSATLVGHSAPVLSVAYTPDGRTVASASRDGTVRLWGRPTAPLVLAHTITAHESQVWFATFAPDGKTLATGSGDSTVRLWDAATMSPLFTLRVPMGSVGLGLFTADGKTLITSCYDRTIRLWDLPERVERRTIRGHSRSVTFIALAPDGKRLASASEDHTVRLWDPVTGEQLRVFPEQPALVNGVAYSPDGKTLAAAVGDRRTDDPGFVKLWDVETGQERATLAGFRLAVSKVAYSPDGRLLAASSHDGTIKLWNAAAVEERVTLHSESAPRPIAYSPDGRTLASGHANGSMTLWDVETGTNRLTQKAHDRGLLGISFAPDGLTLATASVDGKAKFWRVPDPRRNPLP